MIDTPLVLLIVMVSCYDTETNLNVHYAKEFLMAVCLHHLTRDTTVTDTTIRCVMVAIAKLADSLRPG